MITIPLVSRLLSQVLSPLLRLKEPLRAGLQGRLHFQTLHPLMYSHYISSAVLQAGAIPIRVVIMTTKQEVSSYHISNTLNPDFPVASFVCPMGAQRL